MDAECDFLPGSGDFCGRGLSEKSRGGVLSEKCMGKRWREAVFSVGFVV